jgi:hypothetical protein
MADYPDHTAVAQKLLDQQAQINQLTAEIARLHTGEEDGYDPLVRPTPGQWLRKFNQSPAAERLAVVARVIDACAQASTCFEMNHDARIRQLEELLHIAHETSNRSEAERAAAAQRAERAEATIERVRRLIAGRWGVVDPDLVRDALDGTEQPTAEPGEGCCGTPGGAICVHDLSKPEEK